MIALDMSGINALNKREIHSGIIRVLALSVFALLFLSLDTTILTASDAIKHAPKKQVMSNSFFVLSNGVEGPGLETPEAKAALLAELGYDGIGPSGVVGVGQMLEALDRHDLAMHALYIGINLDADKPKYDPRLKNVIETLKGRPTIIWLYVLGGRRTTQPPHDDRAVEIIHEIAAMAEDSGLRVALYPHYGFYVSTVADALRVAERVDRKNVGITLNVCHCLKNGNGRKIHSLLRRTMPRLMVVTINGADHEGGWDRLIQTLDRGEFDMLKFLKTVHRSGFTGPIGLQCYGIKGDARRNLTRSMQAWRELTARVADDICTTDGNRLTHLDNYCDPYNVGLHTARLAVPQWVGEPGVEAVLVLAIDDMREVESFETYLRPILNRLKEIDGRAAVSIMTNSIDLNNPHLQKWLDEGLNFGAHTLQHRCPCLQSAGLAASKQSFDASVDTICAIPGNRAVAYRMPCCDSMNTVSPRFFTEVFNKTTPKGNFLSIDSSIFNLFTADDPTLPRKLVVDAEGRERFGKYATVESGMVNLIEDYPYPYVIGRLCWELPCLEPSDWVALNRGNFGSRITVEDWKAAVDALVIKQGAAALCFHPYKWIGNDRIVELIDHAVTKHHGKVKFLNLTEVKGLLTRNVLGGQPLRAANGQDNGVRLMDINGDGHMDAVVGNEKVCQTRLWSPQSVDQPGRWIASKFPLPLVSVDTQGSRTATGIRFGVLQKNGMASFLICNEKFAGLWHFDGKRWVKDAKGLDGLEVDRIGSNGPIFTSKAGRDRGVRLRDLDGDGICELVVGNEKQNAVFAWTDGGGWKKLLFRLPAGTTVVDAQGRDAGLRFVDIDEDGRDDVLSSNAQRYSLHLFDSMNKGWSGRISQSSRSEGDEIPMIVRGDGTNNGAWFAHRHMRVQNEHTGGILPHQIDSRSYKQLLKGQNGWNP